MVQEQAGLVVLEMADEGGVPVRIAMFDTVTKSGIEVIGLGFAYAEDAPDVIDLHPTAVSFGPQPVSATRNGTNHSHQLQWPFSSCSYVYNYASGDSYLHLCPNDITLLQYVGTMWATLAGVAFLTPVLGWIPGLVVFAGIQNFKNPDGSLDFYAPSSSINSSYGNTYYYGALGGWYYHYPQGNSLYGYARRLSTGFLYYERWPS
ncbi:MAG: hypothetical protein HYX54_11005 [Chloroflexi bacterium]|nr:hypothetical protein [Chloroflexota bacterium]